MTSPDETPEQPRTFDHVDLSGARFRKVRLTNARMRMVDLSGAVLRDVSLAGASIDGAELEGLRIDGVKVAPLIEAELARRDPARALRSAADPQGLQEAWAAIERSWEPEYERAARLPASFVNERVEDEWSFAETLRHLVFATDGWLGAALRADHPFHPWGLPFTEFAEFGNLAELGIDPDANPSYEEILALRNERVAQVRTFLDGVTTEQLEEQVTGPVWYPEQLSVLRCLSVILSEELDHLRFARRDLDVIETRPPQNWPSH